MTSGPVPHIAVDDALYKYTHTKSNTHQDHTCTILYVHIGIVIDYNKHVLCNVQTAIESNKVISEVEQRQWRGFNSFDTLT